MAETLAVSEHVGLLSLYNPTRSNIWVVHGQGGHALVDPGPVSTAPVLLALDRRGELRIERVLLTHAHPAHAGAAARVCRGTGVSAWASEADAPFLDGREPPLLPRGRRGQLMAALGKVVDLCPPLYRLERLVPGVPVGDLVPIATPGHSPGHVCLYHRKDRVLLAGDAFVVEDGALRLPEEALSDDPALARASLRALLDLDVAVIAPGHGPPLTTGAPEALRRLAG